MKKPEQFERKRRMRDKAHHRFLKNRHLILPGVMSCLFAGAALGGLVGKFGGTNDTVALGLLVGAVMGVALGLPYVERRLSQ